jgi:hypothetical protein
VRPVVSVTSGGIGDRIPLLVGDLAGGPYYSSKTLNSTSDIAGYVLPWGRVMVAVGRCAGHDEQPHHRS